MHLPRAKPRTGALAMVGTSLLRSDTLQYLAALSLLTITSVSVHSSLRILQASATSPEPFSNMPAEVAWPKKADAFGNGSRHSSFSAVGDASSMGRSVRNSDVISEEGSRAATVMAFAMNYGLFTHRRYVGSLRKSGFDGNIILWLEAETKPGVRDYLHGKGVKMRNITFVNCSYTDIPEADKRNKERLTCAHPYPDIKVRWSRFPLIRDYLAECEECTGPVLISDYRDAFFQRNPFAAGEPAIRGLQVFQEHRRITTDNWLVQWPVNDCKGIKFEGKPMLCSGTTLGEREAMLKYLTAMHEEMKVWMADPKCHFGINGDDQSIHNFLFYTGKLPFATSIAHRTGIVHTVGAQGSIINEAHKKRMKEERGLNQSAYDGADEKNWLGLHYDLTDKDGFFVNMDGSRSHVIHQYDRFGNNFVKWLAKQEGNIWD